MFHWIDRSVPADLFVVSGATTIGLANTPMEQAVSDEISTLPGVEAIDRVRLVWTESLGLRIGLYALDWRAYASHSDPMFTAGDSATATPLLDHGAILVSDNFARKKQLKVGDKLPLRTPAGLRDFAIAGVVVDYSSDQGIVIFDRESFGTIFGDHLVDSVDIFATKGADLEALRREIDHRFGERFDLRISTNADLRRAVFDLIDDFFSLVYVLLFIAVVVGVLGVVGTLLAQVLDRTGEIGILRAMGASRGQILAAITIEAALLGVAGALLGVPAGLLMGRVFVDVIGVQATGWLFPTVLPVSLAFAGALASTAFAALGGLLPARRAAALDVVEAIGYE
jgi:putative ABC transport system permease protein